MGWTITHSYSLELETDSGQILCIRGVRLELIANVCFDLWILGRIFVREYDSQLAYPDNRTNCDELELKGYDSTYVCRIDGQSRVIRC